MRPTSSHKFASIIWISRGAFIIALMGLCIAVFSPDDTSVGRSGLTPWDKADHFIAFYGLTLIAIAAFPNLQLRYLVLTMTTIGFVIESVQPLVGRETNFADGVANTFGVLAATTPVALSRWRRLMKSFQ